MQEDHEQRAMAAIENAISDIAAIPTRPAVPLVASPERGIEEVGRMAADAVLQVYEDTARQVEQMGDEVKERIRRLAEALAEADGDLKWLSESALAIRTKGEGVRQLVEAASNRSREIRQMCDQVKNKLDE